MGKPSLKIIALLILLIISACGDSNVESEPSMGVFTLKIADAPIEEIEALVMEFTGVVLETNEGEKIELNFESPKTIDFLALSLEGEVLVSREVPSGSYSSIMLKVNTEDAGQAGGAHIVFAGERRRLAIMGENQSEYIQNQNITKLFKKIHVLPNGRASFTVDFELRKSLYFPESGEGRYGLMPAFRIVDDSLAGKIDVAMDKDFPPDPLCVPVVYIFKGNVEPHDMRENMGSLVTVSEAVGSLSSSYFEYSIGRLEADSYTAAPTCQAHEDDPSAVDEIYFLAKTVVDVEPGRVSSADFMQKFGTE